MSDNLRERTDEKLIGIGYIATDAYPYIRFEKDARVLKFMMVSDMPTFVVAQPVGNSDTRVQWIGWYKDQFYTDFIIVTDADEAALKEATRVLLEQAEDTFLTEIAPPAAAPEVPEKQLKEVLGNCPECHFEDGMHGETCPRYPDCGVKDDGVRCRMMQCRSCRVKSFKP